MRGGGAVSHPGVGNIGGVSHRWLTAAQRLYSSENQRRPMRLRLDPPINSQQPIRVRGGRTLESLLCIQRGTTERSPRKKGKVTQERKKLMVVVTYTVERRGGLYFAINRIVEILWPQTAPDKLSVEFFSVYLKVGFIRLLQRRRFGRYAALGLRDQRWSFRHYSCGS